MSEEKKKKEVRKNKSPHQLPGSIHPDWERYSKIRKKQSITGANCAEALAEAISKAIAAQKDMYFTKNENERDEINFEQFVLESLINILQKSV